MAVTQGDAHSSTCHRRLTYNKTWLTSDRSFIVLHKTIMWILTAALVILLDDIRVFGQSTTLYGCPEDWEIYKTKCYKFEINNKLIYEEADAECWVHGARLLTVSSLDEHTFIARWLKTHDSSYPTSTWFTSGQYQSGMVTWDEESSIQFNEGGFMNEYWAKQRRPTLDNPHTRIAYVFQGGLQYDNFGWDVVSTSVPAAYICEVDKRDLEDEMIAVRGFEYGQGLVDPLNIQKGPQIIAEPISVVVFANVPAAYLECGAYSNPHPGFYWKRNWNENVTSKTDTRYTISGGRFTIQDPDRNRDRGFIQCVASNKYGSVLSQPAEFLFGSLQEFSPVKPADVIANKFEGTRIDCQAPAAYPAATYRWYTDTIDDYIFSEMYPHRFISQSGYLYFSEVQPTDDNRLYKCVVTLSVPMIYNQASNQAPSRTSLGIVLRVTGTEHGLFEPFIYTHIFPQKAIRGTRIRLECIAYGSLPLTYSWARENDRPFPKGTTFEDLNRVLQIDNAQIDAEGKYICIVDGRGGYKRKTLSLSIEATPYFPYGIKDKFMDPGKSLQWRCKAVARPAPTYAWYKNGKLIESVPGVMEVKGNYLHFPSVDKERDEGMYQCSATNVHGTSFSTGQLKILSFKPTFDRHPLPPTTLAPMGGNITIPCAVEAAPKPQVEWQRRGTSLGLVPGDVTGQMGMTLTNSLVLRDLSFGDRGLYTCKASNTNGEAFNSTFIEVIRGVTFLRPPQDTQARVNTTAFIFCQANHDINYDLTYVWLFNGHLIDYRLSQHFVQSHKGGVAGLYIRHAQFEHSGVYECQARTTLHTVRRSARLVVIGPPGPPAGVYIDPLTVTPYSARIIWTIGVESHHGSPIYAYDVETENHIYPGQWNLQAMDVREFDVTKTGLEYGLRSDQRTYIVQNLIPNLGYSFRVRAINDLGRGKLASKGSVIIKTPSTAPVTAPKFVTGGGGSVGTLTIRWKAVDKAETCGPEFGYNVYFKKKDDPKDWMKAMVMDRESEMYTHLVGPDFFYLQYEVKVGTFNVHGDGPNSSVVTIYSAEGMPVARPVMGDCENYNGSAIYMEWTPVPDDREHMKGRVKGYKIQYRLLDDDPDYDYIWNRDVYGQQENAIIIGLRDNTNYWVRVQVFNTAGIGPIGEWRLAETFHLPPQEYPRHVTVYNHGPHSVRVTWQGVQHKSWHEESLQGYIVRVWKIQEDIRTANDTLTSNPTTEAIIDNLQQKTVYVLRVLGYSIGGEGSKSPHVYFTVGGGSVPFDPATTRYCFDDRLCDDGASAIHISYLLLLFLLLLSCFVS